MSLADSLTSPAGEAAGIPYSERGPASIETVASFGFWLFLLSDVVHVLRPCSRPMPCCRSTLPADRTG